jgi:hypothetical protein
MRDIDKIVQYLEGFIPSSKALEFLEKPIPDLDGQCILDLLQTYDADTIIAKLEEMLE